MSPWISSERSAPHQKGALLSAALGLLALSSSAGAQQPGTPAAAPGTPPAATTAAVPAPAAPPRPTRAAAARRVRAAGRYPGYPPGYPPGTRRAIRRRPGAIRRDTRRTARTGIPMGYPVRHRVALLRPSPRRPAADQARQRDAHGRRDPHGGRRRGRGPVGLAAFATPTTASTCTATAGRRSARATMRDLQVTAAVLTIAEAWSASPASRCGSSAESASRSRAARPRRIPLIRARRTSPRAPPPPPPGPGAVLRVGPAGASVTVTF
jgi:hypothetical protein